MRACVYLCDLTGAPQQVVDVAVEFQLPLSGDFFDVRSTQHHLVGETTNTDIRSKCGLHGNIPPECKGTFCRF